MVATNRFLKHERGEIAVGMKVWDFLAQLATVMNTSVECLVRDYIRVPVQDFTEQQRCYMSVFEDKEGSQLGGAPDELQHSEMSDEMLMIEPTDSQQ